MTSYVSIGAVYQTSEEKVDRNFDFFATGHK